MSQSYLDVAIEAAREAGALQRERLGEAHKIEFKGELNPVTEVDRACEERITKKIQSAFPSHDILAEEGGGKRRDSEFKWIIDPLDGTVNYTHGYPLFCVSIALEKNGKIVLGVVYEPNRDELFCAEEGGGATLNGGKIHVSKTAELGKSLLCTGFAYNVKKTARNNLSHFRQMILSAQAVRRDGVAAVDLCYVACGRFDGFWELNLFPWDVAAGALMVTEAGGALSEFSGRPFSVYAKEIVASNGRIHSEMTTTLISSEKKKKNFFMPLVSAKR